MLLFDDENFSISRLYFRVIDCLNELIISIADNIKQRELYRQARLLDPSTSRSQLGYYSLEDLRAQFQAKLETVHALHDGHFNASALIENRSSTRLGQNVKLLTYVSIVYLPLGFCAALCAITNVISSHTLHPFITTAILVSLATYMIVVNLGQIAEAVGKAHCSRRQSLLNKMKKDSSDWQSIRKRLEEFPPNNERKTPAEWWIYRYQMRILFKHDDYEEGEKDEESASKLEMFRNWMHKLFEKNQGWE
ncbi:hypothetical protein GGS21DRAFT_489429 [Xylaria nigripes]|nr:hypothetical protein GGS21DRAFT_489429 [Xylaria nigripes]